MAKVAKVKNNKVKKTVPAIVPASAFYLLQRQQNDIKRLETELATLRKDHQQEEEVVITMLESGHKPYPNVPPFYVEKSFRKNIKWRKLFEREFGVIASKQEHSKWPDDEYKHVRFGKPPAKTKRRVVITVYQGEGTK